MITVLTEALAECKKNTSYIVDHDTIVPIFLNLCAQN